MICSEATGGSLLVELAFHDQGRPFAGIASSTTKCCSSGTCDQGPASRILKADRSDPRDPERLAATLGSLDEKTPACITPWRSE